LHSKGAGLKTGALLRMCSKEWLYLGGELVIMLPKGLPTNNKRDAARVSDDCQVSVRFHEPPEGLRRYFTSFYYTDVAVAGNGRVVDYLHPEWAGLRFIDGDLPEAQITGSAALPPTAFFAHGPTSTTIRFVAGTFRMWGVGLLPLGWAQFAGTPANALADVLVDGHDHPTFAGFAPLADTLFERRADPDAELERIVAHFAGRLDRKHPDENRILACHAGLVDPEVATVAEMAEHAALPAYTLERLCRRHFGFAPQLLLRRQRFMRSLSQFMLDPSLKWIGALDDHYHDQAQFVRDFHRFMGMSPREYGNAPHPIIGAIMRSRFENAGAAVQALHVPAASRRA
jgi:AraC-like DNA-binding protein